MPASQARVIRLWWLERLSVITAIVPVGLACSTRLRNSCQWALLREGAQQITPCPSPIRTPPSIQVLSGPRPYVSGALSRWPSALQPAGGSKVRGITGPSSSAAMSVVCAGGCV
jgi:hypothetical protein